MIPRIDLTPLLLLAAFVSANGAVAQPVDRSVVFTLDSTLSSVTVTADVNGGASDSDSSPLNGTVNSILTIDPTSMTPLITGLGFTGGRYSADNNLELDLPLLGGLFNLHVDAIGLAGKLTTPFFQAPITSTSGGNLSYTFSAANHQTTTNEGLLNISGFVNDQLDLATIEPPVQGPGPGTPQATLGLTQGSTIQNLTQFSAQLDFPIDFTSVLPVDDTNNANIRTTGTLVATGTFLVDIGLTGTNALLLPSDRILAIDLDGRSQSASPVGEGPENVVDGTAALKHVNLGGANSGFIVTPTSDSSQVQSMRFTSANDFPERDPATWELFGTNEPISSENHSLGSAENWTFIGTGATALPDSRNTAGPLVQVTNNAAFSSYKVLFPTAKNLNDPVQHLAEAEFFTNPTGSGADVLNFGDSVLAIDADFVPDSSYPGNETPSDALDGNSGTKYLNFGGKNSGFIVTPALGPSVVDGFQVTTANDFELRDPAAWQLFGTNEGITSADNSQGDSENWTFIDSGTFTDLQIPFDRFETGDVVGVANVTAYRSYRMVFTDLRDSNDPIMQISDIQFYGSLADRLVPGDFDQDGDIDGGDFLTWQRGLGTDFQAGDLAIWESAYAEASAGSTAAELVPEPGNLAFLLCGGPIAVMLRQKRGSQRRHHEKLMTLSISTNTSYSGEL